MADAFSITAGPDRRAAVAGQLARMQRLFTVYRPMLSESGRRIASLVAGAAVQKPVRAGGERLAELMPRSGAPLDLSLGGPDNWYRWFDLSKYHLDRSPIGRGCTDPCGPCGRDNGVDNASLDPLPVVVKKMEIVTDLSDDDDTGFSGWRRNDLFQWQDPFFGASLDTVLAFNLRRYGRQIFHLFTRGWGIGDGRTQRVAENIARLPLKDGVTLSFHLGLSEPGLDIVKAVYENGAGGREVPAWLIDGYAERTANIARALDRQLDQILLYHRIRVEDGADEGAAAAMEQATVAAIRLSLQKIGIGEAETQKFQDRSFNWGEGPFGRRSFCVIDDYFDLRAGKARDFYRRLQSARQGRPDYFRIDGRCITDGKDVAGRDEGPVRTGYPRVNISGRGRVTVNGFSSTLDELDPLGQKASLI